MQKQKDVFRSFLVKDADYDEKCELPCIKTSDKIPNKVITFSKAMSKSCKEFDSWVIFYKHDKNFERLLWFTVEHLTRFSDCIVTGE